MRSRWHENQVHMARLPPEIAASNV